MKDTKVKYLNSTTTGGKIGVVEIRNRSIFGNLRYKTALAYIVL